MADGALLLVDAAEGPLPQTRFVLAQVPRARLPRHRRHQQDRPPRRAPRRRAQRGLRSVLRSRGHRRRRPTSRSLYAIGQRGHRQALARGPSDDARAALRDDPRRRSRRPRRRDRARSRSSSATSTTTTTSAASRSAASSPARSARNQPVGVVEATASIDQGHDQGALDVRGPQARADAGSRARARSSPSPGIEEVYVGDTITDPEPGSETRALPRILVEQPTIKMRIGVNTSPFAGKCKLSKFLTSRHLRERLERETRKNLAIRVEETDSRPTRSSCSAAASCSSPSWSRRCAARATRCSSATPRS